MEATLSIHTEPARERMSLAQGWPAGLHRAVWPWLCHPDGLNVIVKVLMRERQEGHSQGRRQWKWRLEDWNDEAKESQQPLEAENSKEMDYPLRDSRKKSALVTLWLHPTEPNFRLLTSRTIKEYSFESLKKREFSKILQIFNFSICIILLLSNQLLFPW